MDEESLSCWWRFTPWRISWRRLDLEMFYECMNRMPQCFPANGIIRDGSWIGLLAQQVKRRTSIVDDRCRHRFQDQFQGGLRSGCSGRGIEQCDGLSREIRAAYEPIKHVLERPWYPARVFGAGNKEAVRLTYAAAQVNDALRKVGIEVRSEVRQLANRIVMFDCNTWRRQQASRNECVRIGRRCA